MARKAVRKRTQKKDTEERDDGYVNSLTGVGDYLQDKTLGGNAWGLGFVVRDIYGRDCEDRWRGSDLGARIVETIPDEMTRQGWELVVQPEDDEDKAEAQSEDDSGDMEMGRMDAFPQKQGNAPVMVAPEKKPHTPPPDFEDESAEIYEDLCGALDELDAEDAIWKALCFERAFGGAAIFVGAQDGQDYSKPLAEDRIKSVDFLNVFQGGKDGEVIAWTYYLDPAKANYGRPETYKIRNIGMPMTNPGLNGRISPVALIREMVVHESRLLIFGGAMSSRLARINQMGWGDSIFTRVDEILAQYGQTWGAIASLMTDFSQAIVKTPGLSAALAGRNKAANSNPITRRALAIQQSRSLVRMLFLDSEEEFTRDTATLSGISDILQQFALRLAAAADMPVTLLMGQSPSGLNATGDSDIRFFYDRIAAKQKRKLLPRLRQLVRMMFLAKDGPTEGKEPARWNIKFNPLYQLTEVEQATLRKTVAETDQIYINAQVLSPEEVTASAFGGSEWTMERQIDFEGRQKMADDAALAEEDKKSIMSEAAAKGVDPGQLALEHPENPLNLPKARSEEEPKADEWNEEDHPREENGQFGEGSSGDHAQASAHVAHFLSHQGVKGKAAGAKRALGELVKLAESHSDPVALANHLEKMTAFAGHEAAAIRGIAMDLRSKAEGKPTQWLGRKLPKQYQSKK